MNFDNEVVLITGASNGIGRGLAYEYANAGAYVILVDMDQKGGKELEEELNHTEQKSIFIACDVRNPNEVKTLFDKVHDTVGTITILINNAGVSKFSNLFDLTIDNWDDIINTNLRSVFLFSKLAASIWKESNVDGRIVNIASTRAFMSEPNSEAYAASKGGIVALTHALAISLGDYHIRVNAISPGWIQNIDYDQLREIDHSQHPAGRVGFPKDIAKACFYLTDSKNDFVTGTNLIVDGGMTQKMIYHH